MCKSNAIRLRRCMLSLVSIWALITLASGLAVYAQYDTPLRPEKSITGTTGNPPVNWPNGASYKGPLNPFASRGYGGQCTAFAWGRANEVTGTTSLPAHGDAKTWYANTTLDKGGTPRANSVAVWKGDHVNPHGHVAFVEDVVGDFASITEANVETFKNTNFGGGYDGRIKQISLSRMANRGRGVGELIGYIYLTPPPSTAPPSVSRLSTDNLISSNSNQDIVIYGTNFQPNLTVSVTFPNGSPGPTLSGAQISGVTPGSFVMSITLGAPGTWKIKVNNPDGGESSPFSFPVRAPTTQLPIVSGIAPTVPTAGSADQNITITGNNFQPQLTVSVVFPGGRPGPTLSGAQVLNVTSGQFTLRITLNAVGTWGIKVNNPDGGQSDSFSFQVQASANPAPAISSILPTTPTASGTDQDVTVFGSNFQPGLKVGVTFPGGIPGPTLSGAQILNVTTGQFTMRATLGATGTWRITVFNPDGGQSSPFGFNVQAAANQQPVITGINPSTPTASSTDQDVTVFGSNFQANLTVSVTFPGGIPGPTLSGAQILNVTPSQFTMRATLGAAGTWSIRVNNPNGGGQSGLFSFTVQQPVSQLPAVSQISPASPVAVVGNQNVIVSGSNFQPNLTVTVFFPGGGTGTLSGAQILNVTPTSFTMVIDFNGNPGSYSIRVNNPNNGGQSATFNFTVQSQQANPAVSSIAPSSPPVTNSDQSVQVLGSNFQPGLTVDVFNAGGTKLGTLSGAQILNFTSTSFTMLINLGSTAGSFGIEVVNPNGGRSARFSFSTHVTGPTVTSISPNPVPTFNANQNVQVNGSNFQANLTVDVFNSGGTKISTLSGTQLLNVTSTSFTMVVNLGSSASSFGIEVVNPDGGRSTRFTFSTVAPAPSVSSISPSTPPVANGNQNVQVFGGNFQSGLTVDVFNGAGTKLGTLSGTQILNVTPTSFTMVVNLGSAAGSFGIEVVNPNGGRSSRFNFSTQATGPAVSSISPNPVPTFNSNQNVQVFGSNFQSNLTVDVFNSGGSKLATLSGSQVLNVTSTSFTMVVNLGSSASSFGIEVVNPDGGRSSRFNFSTTAFNPSVSSISPNPVPVFNGNQNVQVFGGSFQSGLIVDVFNGSGTKVGTLSGTQILNVTPTSFTMVINLGSTASTFGIEVVNPNGGRSARFSFTTH
jgi:surface antigen